MMRKCDEEKCEIFSDIAHFSALFRNESRGTEQNPENTVHPERRPRVEPNIKYFTSQYNLLDNDYGDYHDNDDDDDDNNNNN
jgi:hypothetical protein